MSKKFFFVVLAALLVSGCNVTPAKVVFTEPPTNKTINVYSVIEQDELEALYPISDSSAATMQFGLVGALVGAAIDTSINKSNAEIAEENLKFIRNELIGLEFDRLFEEEIVKKLEGNINVGDIKTVKSHSQLKKMLKPGETYLVLNTSYKMDIDFRTPFIVTTVNMYEKGAKKSKDVQLYQNTFTYFGLSLPAPTKTEAYIQREIDEINTDFAKLSEKKQKDRKYRLKRQKAIKKVKKEAMSIEEANEMSAYAWSTEYKEELDAGIREGIQDLFSIISEDMKDKTLPETYAKSGETLQGYPDHHKSLVVKETEDDMIIRFTQGHRAGAVCSMPKENDSGKLVCL